MGTLIDDSGQTRFEGTIEGALPANVTWDTDNLKVYEASATPGPFEPILFRLKTLLASGLDLSVNMAAYFSGALTTYNDNGAELLESDPLANGGDGEVRISGKALTAQSTFPVSLADGENVSFAAATDPTTSITVSNVGGHLVIDGNDGGAPTVELSTTGVMSLLGQNVVTLLSPAPEVPATPTAQDVVDALLAYGLITQAP